MQGYSTNTCLVNVECNQVLYDVPYFDGQKEVEETWIISSNHYLDTDLRDRGEGK